MKCKQVLCIALFSIVLMALAQALAESGNDRNVFVMPASLRSIGDGAFEDTMPIEVYLSESVQNIGKRAFAGRTHLSVIYIPARVGYIGEDAFAGRGQVLILGLPHSFAEEWAKKQGYRFIFIDIWISGGTGFGHFANKALIIIRGHTVDVSGEYKLIYTYTGFPFLQNPKEKPELYPIEYDFP